MSQEQLLRFFAKEKIKATISHYQAGKRTIYYATIGEDHLPALLFIHGSPASMTIYKNYFKDRDLLQKFCIYAVDRPGYGLTGGRPEPSIQKQADLIFPLVESIHHVHQPLILTGGSYGASIICRIAMDHPNFIDGLVLVCPSLGPGLEKTYWFTPLLQNKLARKLLPDEYVTATDEKIAHEKELRKMLPLWEQVRIPVSYLQSEHDHLVYSSNADFARMHLKKSPLLTVDLFPGRRHNIHNIQFESIRDRMIAMYHMVKK